MYVLGRTNTKEIYLISQTTPFIINEYLIVEDIQHGSIPVEVVNNYALPMAVEPVMPDGVAVEFLPMLNIDPKQPIYIAKAMVLKTINTPIMPSSKVRKPSFQEVEKILIHVSHNEGFVLGVIEGTGQMHKELPSEIQNIAPGWNQKAIPQNGVPFILNFHKFREYPHIGIFGNSGSGKSFGMRVIQEELMRFSIPALSFDPHMEGVFDKPMNGLTPEQQKNYKGKYEIFYVGKDVGIRFSELNLDELIHLFEYVGALSEPQKGALEALYEKGDTLAHLRDKITDLKTAFEEYEKPKREQERLSQTQEMLFAKYKNRVSGASTLQALSWKLDSLENTNIFDGHVLDVERALRQRKLAVIRGDIRRLQMLSSYMIKKFYKKRRKYQDARERGVEEEYFPMFFIIMDESHNFAPRNSFSPIGQVLRTIALEARKYGVILVTATQRPGNLDDTIFAQLNTKIIYRLNNESEMEMMKKETNLTEEQVKKLPNLLSGSCYVSSPVLPKTFAVKFRTTFTLPPNTDDPFDELDRFYNPNEGGELEKFLYSQLPIDIKSMKKVHIEANNKLKENYSIDEIKDTLEIMVSNGKVKSEDSPFGKIYSK